MRGEYMVLLNNDVVVTDGWLDQLIALVNAKRGAAEMGLVPSASIVPGSAESTPPPCVGDVPGSAESTPPGPPSTRGGTDPLPAVRPIGLVGPMSNFVAPPQLVENVPYRDVDELQRFARQWRK